MRPIPTVILALALSAGAQGANAQAPPQLIAGEVMKVDRSVGKITIKHGPISKLGMDQGMTMVFKAPDPAMLNSIRAGSKIKFDAEQVNGQYTVTKIEKSQ